MIIDERKKGDFKDWKDIVDRVKGVGDKNAAKFSEAGLTVNGAAYRAAHRAAGVDGRKATQGAQGCCQGQGERSESRDGHEDWRLEDRVGRQGRR